MDKYYRYLIFGDDFFLYTDCVCIVIIANIPAVSPIEYEI